MSSGFYALVSFSRKPTLWWRLGYNHFNKKMLSGATPSWDWGKQEEGVEGSWEAVMTQTQPILWVLKLDWNFYELPTKAGGWVLVIRHELPLWLGRRGHQLWAVISQHPGGWDSDCLALKRASGQCTVASTALPNCWVYKIAHRNVMQSKVKQSRSGCKWDADSYLTVAFPLPISFLYGDSKNAASSLTMEIALRSYSLNSQESLNLRP